MKLGKQFFWVIFGEGEVLNGCFYGFQFFINFFFKIPAEDAFIKLGKSIQKRRQTDLYDSATFYVGTEKNPEEYDKDLKNKLDGNKKRFHKNINDLIDQ